MALRSTNSGAKSFKVLVADRDPQTLEAVRSTLSFGNVKILTTNDIESAASTFIQARPRLVLLSTDLLQSASLNLLQMFITTDPAIDVILLAPEYSSSAAVNAIRRGACDLVAKPIDTAKLRQRAFGLMAEAVNRRRTLELDQELIRECQIEGMVGHSPAMLDVFVKIRRFAPHFQTMLLTGAAGTGKELAARALHRLSPSSAGPFIVSHGASLADTMLDRELPGEARSAFGRATTNRTGLLDSTEGGTLFLDELTAIPWQTQGKLVRVLERQEAQRAGPSGAKRVDVKVIAATCEDIPALVREGKFRQDLLALFEAQIRLPSLSERKEDLPLLQRHLLERHSTRYRREVKGITRRAQVCLSSYSWPGNVRELDSVIGQACMLAKGEVLDLHDLPEHVRNSTNGSALATPELLSMREVERRHLQYVLNKLSGNKAKAAMVLGISRATVYEMLSRMKDEKGANGGISKKTAS
jgi:two-component system, NtrC family, response regulator HydG